MTHQTTITPYICFKDTTKAIEFYERAFGAVETLRLPDDDGKISHAEININGAKLLLSDEYPGDDAKSPETIGGTAVLLVLEVPDVDAAFKRALAAGAIETRPLSDRFDGALRNGKLKDPFGYHWMLLSRRGDA